MEEIGGASVPQEFVEFQLCQEMGWTLEYVRKMSEPDFHLALGFMRAQGYAQTQKQRSNAYRQKQA